MSYKDVESKLASFGWKRKRQKGSHIILCKQGKIVPLPRRKDIPKGTIASIERITGVSLTP